MGSDSVSRKSFLAGADPMQSESNCSEPAHKPASQDNTSDERYSAYLRTAAVKG